MKIANIYQVLNFYFFSSFVRYYRIETISIISHSDRKYIPNVKNLLTLECLPPLECNLGNHRSSLQMEDRNTCGSDYIPANRDHDHAEYLN